MLRLWPPVLVLYHFTHLFPIFQPILPERVQTPVGMPGDMNLPVGPPYAGIWPGSLQGSQGPTRIANLDIITSLPFNVLNITSRA